MGTNPYPPPGKGSKTRANHGKAAGARPLGRSLCVMSPTTYNSDRFLKIPTDARLFSAILFGAALGLLIVDTVDLDPSLLSKWATFCALAGLAFMVSGLHSYSRRVILEVMSWEHRQQGMGDDRPLSVVSSDGQV